ncbi:MAG: DUF5916 domain-containing protein [Bacteroidales bacterium]|nr:DUF5916 domain-containing protein [Bacteroidales bacterium]
MGYVTANDNDIIIYGRRDLASFENELSSRLMLKSNLSVSLWMRHYWYQGQYNDYYDLTENGHLNDNNDYQANNDFNFNAFNMDLMLNWRFAPGSNMSLVWKNEVTTEDDEMIHNIYRNIENTLSTPQNNTLSLKIRYHLDYQNLHLFKQNG